MATDRPLSSYLNDNNFKFYRAKVVDNKDPLKLSRVKVWIPDLMLDIPEDQGLWALPANNPVSGGNVEQNDGRKHSGTSYIPKVGDWILVFLENDNLNRPYYLCGLNLYEQPRIPETQTGEEYWNKWVIFRSPKGRSIWISDSPDDARVMITGNKEQYDPNSPTKSVYKIAENQKTIMIQEDKKSNRILLADKNANYISIREDLNNIFLYAWQTVHVFNEKSMVRLEGDKVTVQNSECVVTINGSSVDISSPQQITFQTPGAKITMNGGNITIYASGQITLQAASIQENPGQKDNPSPKSPEPKKHDVL